MPLGQDQFELLDTSDHISPHRLEVLLDFPSNHIRLVWWDNRRRAIAVEVTIRCTGVNELTWEWAPPARASAFTTSHHLNAIRGRLQWLRRQFPTRTDAVHAAAILAQPGGKPADGGQAQPVDIPKRAPWAWLENTVQRMAEQLGPQFALLRQVMAEMGPALAEEEDRLNQLAGKIRQREFRRQDQLEKARQAQAERRARRERAQREREARRAARKADLPPVQTGEPASHRHRPPPEIPVVFEFPEVPQQDTFLPLAHLRSYALCEQAARWWVSNQADDLLALPYCRIERLEFQIRTVLRVIGPLRGRALLSDEVGLGKTIEAGLVAKEYLTRGMVGRILVLTVPSLVDQWAEELSDKFGIETATTNSDLTRSDPASFWREHPAIVASLHTLKQPAHLGVAREVQWDLLIIDEAHLLRNRTTQAWQAVNALPRQFLLLLTATPVQNSLEDLHNLVTLLQPGQFPSPREFKARFVDPKRPHQPREPEALRRLLGGVMIRNTRSNAGLELPARHAETVLFEPDDAERDFWRGWEAEFRSSLESLDPGQASLWGRLLLQAAGSSPAAWRGALASYPDKERARTWHDQAPLEPSWERKCRLLMPLTRGEGGVVVFTQFLQTQEALAGFLGSLGVETFVVNGQTPAPQRQPVVDRFRKRGGALILTRSGTEGRNLQFCHRLVNFDLPWNPMEIEQRIGRLHRLGQRHPVRIYNFVQTGTLQEHLLGLLQDKLNLFELVVGETGLILGDRFGSEDFASEVFRRWRDAEEDVAGSLDALGEELVRARRQYSQVKELDDSLFAQDYESL